jgi:hypothetical protein
MEKKLNHHYSQDHPGKKENRSVSASSKLFQTLEFSGRQERKISEQGAFEEVAWQSSGEEGVQVRR